MLALFDSLDADGSGTIGPEDIVGSRPLPRSLQRAPSFGPIAARAQVGATEVAGVAPLAPLSEPLVANVQTLVTPADSDRSTR